MAKRTGDNDLTENIKENYQSIILGLIVFLIAMVAIYRAINNRQKAQETKEEAASTETTEETKNTAPITSGDYTVVAGDTLWKIAERKYGSGYNWVDIVKANKLANGNMIEKGQKLNLPEVEKKTPTTGTIAKAKTGKVTITGDSYKVQKGDHLWKIAMGAYGDGYEWSKIAKANGLKNPNVIHVGQTLKLPR